MPSLHSSASSARAPERFISSKWIPLMNQLKLIKSSGVPSRGAGLALDAAALPQPALGKIGSCFRLQHPCTLLGRNHLLAASMPTRASHSALIPSRHCGRMGHDRVGCDSAMGVSLSRYKTWIPHKRALLCIPPTSQRSQAVQVSKLPNPGAVIPRCRPVLLGVLESKAAAQRRLLRWLWETRWGMAPSGVQGGAPRPFPERY